MNNDLIPVLIGVGQVTEKDPDLGSASSPLDLMEAATWQAAEDAGITRQQFEDLGVLVVVKSFREATRNSPEALSDRLGAVNAAQWLTPDGGYAPQYLVNRYCAAIAAGETDFVLLSGAEAMATGRKIVKSGGKPDWHVPSSTDPVFLYPDREMWNDHEKAHGIWQASHVYPLFENALRRHYGHSIEQHQKILGELFAPFTEVAAQSPHAWYPIRRSAEEIATATPQNRYVGWPYTKYMNAMNQVNQSASVLLTSVGKAKSLGVDESRWVYLHGCADTSEIWHMSDRVNYHSCRALRVLGEQVTAMAGMPINDIDFLDFYSCFPSAVQIARDEFGIATDDPRKLTVTGGLPFHGGAGNNYVMNSIATMIARLRQHPGKFGLVTANGGYLGKHAAGIYSTAPTEGRWQRQEPATYQKQIDEQVHPTVTETPQGTGTVETYTVVFGRDNSPERGIVIGRLGDGSDPDAQRFFANTPPDTDLLESITRSDFIGEKGKITQSEGINIFSPFGL
jgi:acetyl-CoA C-acetyltransferase